MKSLMKLVVLKVLRFSGGLNSIFIRVHHYAISSKFPDASQVLYVDLLSKFKPLDAKLPLRRFGRNGDGGYVLLNVIPKDTVCISLGIADEISFDEELSPLVNHIYMYDHSIVAPPVNLGNATFRALRVVSEITDNRLEIDITTIFSQIDPSKQVILKVDIEGAEWESFKDIDSELLLRCDQIIFEFHNIQTLYSQKNYFAYLAFLNRLLASHIVVNTHINNWDSYEIIQGVPVPNVLEVTLVRKDLVEIHSGELGAETLNYPNNPSRPEFLLYPFERIF